jgi:hypothetical protein
VPSPNVADALATTFAFPHYFARAPILGVDDNQEIGDAYDPFAKERIYA